MAWPSLHRACVLLEDTVFHSQLDAGSRLRGRCFDPVSAADPAAELGARFQTSWAAGTPLSSGAISHGQRLHQLTLFVNRARGAHRAKPRTVLGQATSKEVKVFSKIMTGVLEVVLNAITSRNIKGKRNATKI